MQRILIIGGGIGGLTAGVALQQRGFDAHVFEAAEELRPVGAGITVPPNAMRVLQKLGLAEAVASRGVPLARMEIRDVDGSVLQVIDGQVAEERHGFPMIGIRRSELQQILASALEAGSLHLGRRFERFEDGPQFVRAHFESGDIDEGALLVAADGLRSPIRRQLRSQARLRYSGQSCYRGLAKMRLPDEMHRFAWELWGGASRFGFLEVDDDSVYWFAPFNAPAGSEARADLVDEIAARYDGFPEVVTSIIRSTPPSSIIRTDLHDLAPMRGWSNGRVVLIGDAAHATTPNLGQGGAQAIEDALALALRLEADGITREALAAFERARAPRTRKIVSLSWRLGKVAHWQHPLLRRVRNALLKATPLAVQQRQTDALLTPVL